MAPNETTSKVRSGDESPLSTTPHPTTATTTPSVVKKTQLYATLSTGMLVASFAVLMPFYQSRRDEFGCDPSCYGRYTSARSFLGLIGGLICGRLSDLFGRRTMLHLGILAALTGLTLSYNATDVTGLYLAMIPGSLFQQNFSVTKALFADLCNEHGLPDDTRAGMVGKLGMAVGLSFMIGPLLGGTVISSFQTGVIASTALVISSGLMIFLIPQPPKMSNPTATKPTNAFFSKEILQAVKSRGALTVMVIRVSMALAFHVFMTIWTPSLKRRFDFGPKDHGRFMSFIGLSYALSQGFIAKKIVRAANNNTTLVLAACALCLGCGRMIAYFTQSLIVVYCTFFFIICSLGCSNTIITAAVTKLSKSSEVGGVFGFLESVESLSGMVGPVLGGYLSSNFEYGSILFVVVVYLFVFVWILTQFKLHVAVLADDAETKKKKE
ncbi:hypothetical protein TL16_g13215, partial [Triparma laevis f. inornata]|uniref:Major facilitator superfamily (MFS) profile domain-containing protein n=2 Tax=Triparma laevis TaxID=1534972 RepID=A0A9W7ALU3_9STRA